MLETILTALALSCNIAPTTPTVVATAISNTPAPVVHNAPPTQTALSYTRTSRTMDDFRAAIVR